MVEEAAVLVVHKEHDCLRPELSVRGQCPQGLGDVRLSVGRGGRRVFGVDQRREEPRDLRQLVVRDVRGEFVGPDGEERSAIQLGVRIREVLLEVEERVEAFGQRKALIRAHRSAGHLVELPRHVVVEETPRKAAEVLASQFARLTPDVALESPFLLLGPLEHLVETLEARRERWGVNYVVIFERALADFAPVVARLAGN